MTISENRRAYGRNGLPLFNSHATAFMPNTKNSDNQTIARGMVTVAALVLLGSIARAGREMAVAYRYGVSAEVDAYLFVFNLINWPLAVWFSVLTVVLVPLAARIRSQSPNELPVFRAELLGITLLIGTALAGLSLWLLPLILRSPAVGPAPQIATESLAIITPMSSLAFFGALVGLFSVWTMVGGKHTNTLLESLPSVCILLAILFLPHTTTLPLVGGTVIGFAIQATALLFFLAFNKEMERPRISMRSPHWKSFFQGFGIMLAGQVLMSFTTVIDQFFAGEMGAGNIATLNYANRILTLLTGVGAMAISRATLPVFARSHERGAAHTASLARLWAQRLFFIGLLTMAVAWLAAPLIVKVFFERGAFNEQNTMAVVDVFKVCVLQIPLYFTSIVVTSYFSSQSAFKVLFWSGVIALAVKSAASALFTIHWGLNGLPLASAAMYAATLAMLVIVFTKSQKRPN